MPTPSTRALIGLAGIALLACLTVFWSPGSEDRSPTLAQPDSDPIPESAGVETKTVLPTIPVAGPALANSETNRRTETNGGRPAEIDPTRAAVSFKIVDRTGDPLKGIEVLVFPSKDSPNVMQSRNAVTRLFYQPEMVIARIETATDGIALIGNLALHSSFLALIQGPGFASVELSFESSGPGTTHDIGSIPLGPSAQIEVEVVQQNGEPVVGSRVDVYAEPSLENYSKEYPPITETFAFTGEDGIAHIDQLPQVKDFHYSFGGQALSGKTEMASVGEPDQTGGRLRVVVPNFEWAVGRVRDVAGNPVAGGQITLRRYESMLSREGRSVEEIRQTAPAILWHSEMQLSHYASNLVSDAEGKFRIRIPAKQIVFTVPKRPEAPYLISAAVLIGDYLGVASKWSSPDQELEIVVPNLYPIRGQVPNTDGQVVPDAQIAFHPRPGPGGAKVPYADLDHATLFQPSAGALGPQGNFAYPVPSGNYWMEILVPGGHHRFPGPYLVEGPLDLGKVEIPNGRTVRLVVKAENPAQFIHGLEARRNSAPAEDGSRLTRFWGGAKGAKTPWGESDWSWSSTRSEAEIVQNTATWRNEPDRKWRYLLEAPGFVPAVVDLDLGAGSVDQKIEVTMQATGQVVIQLSQRTGEPATGITVQISPADGVAKHPMHEELGRTVRAFHRETATAIPDQDGIVRFRNLFPGEYQIISMEGEDRRSYFPRPNADHPVLAKFAILAGQTTEIQASLATMAELRIWVSQNGQLIPGAEVFAVPEDDNPFGIRKNLDPEPAGKTGSDGSFVVPSLTPDQTHTVGARLANATRDRSTEQAWVMQKLQTTAGIQEITLEIPTGGVQLQIAGDDFSGKVEVLILSVDPLATTTDQARSTESIADRIYRTSLPAKFSRIFRKIAKRSIEMNQLAEISGLPPGEYQAFAEIHSAKRVAQVTSGPFRVEDQIVDLGILKLVELVPVKVTVTGIPEAIRGANRDVSLTLSCFQAGAPTAAEASMRVRENRIENWMLKPAEYQLILYDNQFEAARSQPFQVVTGSPTEFTWTVTGLKLKQE
jgi:hypothetical protein